MKYNIMRQLTKNILNKRIFIFSVITLFLMEIFCVTLLVNIASSETILALDDTKTDDESSTTISEDKETTTSNDESSPEEQTDISKSDSTSSKTTVDTQDTNTKDDSTNSLDITATIISNSTDINDEVTDVISNASTIIDTIQNEREVQEDEIASIIKSELGDLSLDVKKEVIPEKLTSIEKIKFIPSTNLTEVNVTVINLKDKPDEITRPPIENITIYKYLDIKLTTDDEYVKDSDINSLEFNFKVEQTWLKENKIGKVSIILMRYHNNSWQSLNTSLINEDENYLYYNSETPGCSTFAIVGSKVVEKQESYTADNINIPWSIIIIMIISLIVILVAILFKARYIYIK